MSKELDRELEENLKKAQEENQRKALEMQQQAMEMQQQLMQMQQQAMQAGGMTPEMLQQMQQYQQQMMQAAMGGDMSALFGDDEEEEQAKADFIAEHPQPAGMSKYLAFGSFFVALRDEPLQTIEMMGEVDDYVEEMDDSWDIDGREPLLEMLASLLEGRAYDNFNDTYLALKKGELDDIDEEEIEDYQTTLESLREAVDIPLKEINKCPSILAWDLERGAYLARTGLHAGYITADEAWDYLKKVAAKAKNEFSSWTEYAVSIVMGRAVHMGYHEAYIYAMQELLEESPEFLNERPLSGM